MHEKSPERKVFWAKAMKAYLYEQFYKAAVFNKIIFLYMYIILRMNTILDFICIDFAELWKKDDICLQPDSNHQLFTPFEW